MQGSGGAAGRERKVAVIGGGLAGLAVSYHLLNMTKPSDMPDYSITIMDESVSDLHPGKNISISTLSQRCC